MDYYEQHKYKLDEDDRTPEEVAESEERMKLILNGYEPVEGFKWTN